MISRVLRIISRLIIGLLFTFSGFVKAVDPLGSAYKFSDYFDAFNISWLSSAALGLAFVLIACEMVIGLNMLIGIRVKQTSVLALLFMSFFTILTLVIAITNPVSDCGCFGDAIILTNWQTFWKNVIFMIPTIIIVNQRRWYKPLYFASFEKLLVFVFIAFVFTLSTYNYRNLPVLDFRPYSIGTHIPDKMIIPKGKPVDKYQTVLVYEKNGVQKDFTMENYPWQDTTWKWVETRQDLVEKGYQPPIHDFIITNPDGMDITPDILSDSGYTYLLIAYDFDNSNTRALKAMNDLALKVRTHGNQFYCVTSSTNDGIESMKQQINPDYEICIADEITLKTIVRANPGLLLIKEGTIIGKWHYRNIPDITMFGNNDLAMALSWQQSNSNKMKVWLWGFILVTLCLLFNIIAPRERRR